MPVGSVHPASRRWQRQARARRIVYTSAHSISFSCSEEQIMANSGNVVQKGARGGAPRVSTRRATHTPAVSLTDFRGIYASTPDSRIRLIRQGIRASELKNMVRLMDFPQEELYQSLGISTATVNRKAMRNEALSSDDSERTLGMARLIGQVQAMVAESGNPEGFDAAKWLSHWLQQPLPALDGNRPLDYMDTIEGQMLVSNLLAMMQSGAYA
jgi:putative toxin-antitoxin system antitoxin component (TIGR02293 family)